MLSSLFAGFGHGLTWKPRTNQIDRLQFVSCQRREILVAFDVGPMLREHLAAKWIKLDLPFDLK